MLIDRRILARFDWPLIALLYAVPLCGLVVLYSAGYDPDSHRQIFGWLPIEVQSTTFLKQLSFLALGTVVMIGSMLIPTTFLHRFAYAWYAICFILLALVLSHHIGQVQNGSRRWISLGGFNFQPAELMKLGLTLCLARFICRYPPPAGGYRLKQLAVPFAIVLAPMALIMAQPDLGTALSVGAIGAILLLSAGVRWKVLLGLFLGVSLAAVPAWHKLHDYQKKRLLVLLDPDVDPQGSGYHIIQSKIAVGSGGLTGRGYLKGTQSHLEFLPEHTTDFVFSVLGEEWGFAGCILVIALYCAFVLRLLRTVNKARDSFSALVALGVTSSIFVHAVINIGMVVGIFPVVGIPLPLFSYGGSSLLSTMFSLGIVLGVGLRRFALLGKR